MKNVKFVLKVIIFLMVILNVFRILKMWTIVKLEVNKFQIHVFNVIMNII